MRPIVSTAHVAKHAACARADFDAVSQQLHRGLANALGKHNKAAKAADEEEEEEEDEE